MLRSLAALVFSILPYPLALGGIAAIVSDLFDWELALGVGGSAIDVPQDMYAGFMFIVLAAIVFVLERNWGRITEAARPHKKKLWIGAGVAVLGLIVGGNSLIVALDGGPAITAAINGESDTLAEMFERGEVEADDHDPMMLWAAQKGHNDTIRVLLDNGVSPNAKRHDGVSALRAACNWGGDEAVALLKEAGAEGDC